MSDAAAGPTRRRSVLTPSDRHFLQGKVLVTGAAGFIGSHVAEMLLARGDDIVVVDELNDYYDVRLKYANLAALRARWGTQRVRLYVGDVADAAFLQQVFLREKPTRVVHLGARAGVRPSIEDPFIYIHANVLGSTRMLEMARLHNVRSFVYASSSSVYGGSQSNFFSEEERVDAPVSPYAATKHAAELLAHTYHHLYGLNVTGLRFFTVYGPRGRPDMAPLMFIDSISRGLPITQFGDGHTSRDYTYVDDIADGVVRALDRPMGHQIFNLGRGAPVELSAFISTVAAEVGRPALVSLQPLQPGDVPRTCADVAKAARLLGYKPKVGIEEGIRRTVGWYRSDYAPLTPPAGEKDEGLEAAELATRQAAEIYLPARRRVIGEPGRRSPPDVYGSAGGSASVAAAASATDALPPLRRPEALALGPLAGVLVCTALVILRRRRHGSQQQTKLSAVSLV